MFDTQWRATAWNEGAERLYGWSPAEALGREVRSFMRADLSDEQQEKIRRELSERGRWRGEVPAERKDGSRRSIESVNVAIRDALGEITGYLGVHRDVTARSFSDDDVSFMQSMTDVLAAALGRADWETRPNGVREAERNRIARDLHDTALRELTDAFALAVMAQSAATGGDEQQWTRLIAGLQRVDEELRSAIYNLRVSADEERPLPELLSDLVAAQATAAADCVVSLHGQEALPAGSLGPRGAEVLHIVTEAVTNARRHSGATSIRVDAAASTRHVLRLEVDDDGSWPDRDRAVQSPEATGLKGMQERAELLGATLHIGPRPRGGTRVSLELPISGEADG